MGSGRRRARSLGALERRVVWLLGSPRSGTTWLLNLLAGRPEVAKIDEPGIGAHLGLFFHQPLGAPASAFGPEQSLLSQVRAPSPDYVFSDRFAAVWRPALRELILTRFEAQLAQQGAGPETWCVVKEPHGSQAAGMLMATLTASRLLWLVRDGRDVVDSQLDALQSGGWGQFERPRMDDADRLRYVEDRSYLWLRRMQLLQRAYDDLPDARRLRVRYEEARARPGPELARALAWLEVPVTADEAERDADALSFERLPADQRGTGKFTRSARPGAWRENLSAAEQAAMERIIGPKLRELGYAP